MLIKGVLSQAFVCRPARLATVIGSRVIGWGRLRPPPQASGGWRNTPATAGFRNNEDGFDALTRVKIKLHVSH